MDKSLRKNGAGAHNWGPTVDVFEGEFMDDLDEDLPPSADANINITAVEAAVLQSPKDRRASVSTASTGGSNHDDEKEKAIAYRAKALKEGSIDLASIARTSNAVSTSPK
ncbi:hypothetical protein FRB99_008922 [Tulasnella sp. 403]|nr:hypothetical protein FRB99_008922 [Tulasnella sp. 403]